MWLLRLRQQRFNDGRGRGNGRGRHRDPSCPYYKFRWGLRGK